MKSSIKSISLAIAISFFGLNACEKSNTLDEQKLNKNVQTLSDYLGEKIQKDFSGIVVDEEENALENVNITIGNKTTLTDSKGVFSINESNVHTNFASIEAAKEGYKNSLVSIGDSSDKLKVVLYKTETQCLFWFCKHNHSLPNSNQ
ncbi:hypothetical protein FBALC1_14552 [Flavobacteriales bacterium ALC-1]|nr:hypothetical protein FBALC1_14552 [Flavobacteriales bacterium ALC-1]